jgi:RNA polymerase sigma factor (sigma-70 family)
VEALLNAFEVQDDSGGRRTRKNHVSASTQDRLAETLKQLRPRLNQILWSFRLKPEEAEDLLQDVFVVALDHLGRTRIEDLDAWIVVTLRNQCLMFLRKEEARLRRESVWAELLLARQAGRERDLRAGLLSSLAMLPSKHRILLHLRLAGYSNREIATLTGFTIHVVRKNQIVALRRLRKLLGVSWTSP